MELTFDYITPAQLTGYVREAAADFPLNQFILARYLPNRLVPDIEARFLSGGEGIMNTATFRSYDTESPIGSRPGITRTTVELPPISRKLRLSEYDRLRQRANPEVFIQDGLYSDAVRLTREIGARMELARGDALVNGSVTLNENGLLVTVPFGRASGNSVTAATLWSVPASSTPVTDLVTWQQAYLNLMGVAPGSIVMSTIALNNLLQSVSLRPYVANTVGAPSIVSRAALSNVLGAYGLPEITVYDAQVNVAGTATRIIPVNKVLLLPAPVADPNDYEGTELGATMWGATAESSLPEFGLAEGDQPGIVAGVYDTSDPVALWTKAAGIGLPILANPNLSFVATVG